jgi:hypothetical protein
MGLEAAEMRPRALPPDPFAPIPSRSGGDLLVRVTLALFALGLCATLAVAWIGRPRDYVSAQTIWHRGAHNLVELTVVREDEAKLACASDVTLDGLACAFDAQRAARSTPGPDGPLRPYATTSGDLLLGAGLWESATLARPLPAERFTVVCDFEVVGLVRSVALRFASIDAPFDPSAKSLPTGRLHGCSIPP